MKKINKSIISLLTLIVIWVNNSFASSFPSEPMIIYWNIQWTHIENKILKIYDGNNTLLKSVYIHDGKYGTNKTFDLENKIVLNEFEWNLIFQIDDTNINISNDTCNGELYFKKAWICEFNFSEIHLDIDKVDDLDNIPEEEKSEEFDDIFKGKVIETTKEAVKQEIWDNIISTEQTTGQIVVVNKAVDVDTQVTKDLVLVSDTKKEAVFIPKDTNTWNNNTLIEKPVKINSTIHIKSKINKDIYGAIEIPTNRQVNFDKYIRICLDSHLNSTSWIKVYASHDNNSWFYDTSVKNISVLNTQVCFDVNHLTSFVIAKDITKTSSSWGWTSRPYCESDQLVCKQVWVNSYMRPIDNSKCKLRDTVERCNIKVVEDTVIEDISSEEENQKVSTNTEKTNEYKLTSKTYITWVRSFIANKRLLKEKYWLQVAYVNDDEEYNITVDKLLKDINQNMKIQSIKQTMVKHIDTMTTSYAIANDESLSEDLRNTFKVKLEKDIERVQKKITVLKRKDYIVNKALIERKLRRAQQQNAQ